VRLGNSPFYANPIRTGQLKLDHPFYDYALGRYLVDYGISLLGGTWASFWGYFGWVDTPLARPTYVILYWVCGAAWVGLALYGARWARGYRAGKGRGRQGGRRGRMESAATTNGQIERNVEAGLLGYLALYALSVVGTLGAINYYSWRARGVGGGIQGRYYLGAIAPILTLLAVGLLEPLPKRWRPVGHWFLCWAMIVLNGVALVQILLPRYYL
jgi:hypothetical protein